MEWIIWLFIAFGGFVVVSIILALISKKNGPDIIKGEFNFDGIKRQELLKRGLFDNTRWR